jgi:hypothetical protein
MAALIPQLQHSTWAGLKNFKARVLQLKAEANDARLQRLLSHRVVDISRAHAFLGREPKQVKLPNPNPNKAIHRHQVLPSIGDRGHDGGRRLRQSAASWLD